MLFYERGGCAHNDKQAERRARPAFTASPLPLVRRPPEFQPPEEGPVRDQGTRRCSRHTLLDHLSGKTELGTMGHRSRAPHQAPGTFHPLPNIHIPQKLQFGYV